MSLHPVLVEKLTAALEPAPIPTFTRREARLPAVPGKVHAVIGMRRAGKTTFLRQIQADLRSRMAPEKAVYLGFDDDRLAGIDSGQLSALLEEFYRRHPDLRSREPVHFLLDEIQFVPGWDRFLRRVLDTECVEIAVSGSSARMLSREVHTSLRGRGIETVIRPFCFREFLRHRGEEPEGDAARWTAATRSRVEKRLAEFLEEGGFPEVQGLDAPLRIELLQGYVNTVLLRDVVERSGIHQVAALRWVVRQCLRNPAGAFSAHRLHRDLSAQGLGVAKDAVHAFLDHLQDAFLISAVPLASESERRRNSNPRKIYPPDPGLIRAFGTGGRSNVGHVLETVVQNELERRKVEIGYVKTEDGREVDFLARYPAGGEDLIQVCADPSGRETLDRELAALASASREHPRATRLLLVLDREQALHVRAPGVDVRPAAEWLLERPPA